LKFNSFVSPGKSLVVQLNIKKHDGGVWDLMGTGTIDGASAVSARIILDAFNLAERNQNPELRSSDELRRQSARELFAQVWTPPA
jgi:3-hydroxyacyl-[acyl-carrier-protein] dehydratase